MRTKRRGTPGARKVAMQRPAAVVGNEDTLRSIYEADSARQALK